MGTKYLRKDCIFYFDIEHNLEKETSEKLKYNKIEVSSLSSLEIKKYSNDKLPIKRTISNGIIFFILQNNKME